MLLSKSKFSYLRSTNTSRFVQLWKKLRFPESEWMPLNVSVKCNMCAECGQVCSWGRKCGFKLWQLWHVTGREVSQWSCGCTILLVLINEDWWWRWREAKSAFSFVSCLVSSPTPGREGVITISSRGDPFLLKVRETVQRNGFQVMHI